MPSVDLSPEEWGERYRRDLQRYQDFAEQLERLLRVILSRAEVDVVHVESRAKTPESLVSKLRRKDQSLVDPLKQITDLVGVRVILYYLEDIPRVANILNDDFETDPERVEDKTSALAVDQFGYRSVHFIVSNGRSRRELDEWAAYNDLQAEIQVRTSLQHAWAIISHKSDYKRAQEAPASVRRSLFRLSALLELADEQFSQFRTTQARAEAQSKENVYSGQLDIPLDLSSLQAYLDESGRAARIRGIVRESGIATEDVVPISERRLQQDRRDLLSTLHHLGFNTVADFDEWLATRESAVGTTLKAYIGSNQIQPRMSLADTLTAIVMIERRVDRDFATEIYSDSGWRDIEEAIGRIFQAGQSPTVRNTAEVGSNAKLANSAQSIELANDPSGDVTNTHRLDKDATVTNSPQRISIGGSTPRSEH